jgi:hypothetical protein
MSCEHSIDLDLVVQEDKEEYYPELLFSFFFFAGLLMPL